MVEKKENISIGIDGEEEWFIRRMIRRHFGKVAAGSILLPLKAGMTNDSFLFTVHGEKYIFRYNGYGTERLIDRENEKRVYDLIRFLGITEHVVALSVKPGYKISHYYEHSHVCDPQNQNEVDCCMAALRSFHERGLTGVKVFDPFDTLLFYERLLPEDDIANPAYQEVRENILSLRDFLMPFLTENLTLCHIDSVFDNFLFVEGRECPYLIDWEYAGVSDPLIDIAMFAIYANYSEPETNRLLAGYFPEGYSDCIRARIYAYMAVGGLIWRNWCIYKSLFGVTFGEYADNQFRFAKDYPQKVRALLGDS